MQLSLLPVKSALRNAVTMAQAVCPALTNLQPGSVYRAIITANATMSSWMQWLILRVLTATRLATSVGNDVDSWLADFGQSRLPGTYATGLLQFSRNVPTSPALIMPGIAAITTDQTQAVNVTVDTTNPYWNAGQKGYLIPIGVASISVPAQAATIGTAGNIQSGSVSRIAATVPYVDFVTNAVAFSGGVDQESDASARARFQLFIQGLASATQAAILSAANGVQANLKLQYINAYPAAGFYTLYVDDGSGNAPDSVISAVYAAAASVTAAGVTPVVIRPTIIAANINAALSIKPGGVQSSVDANVSAALAAYVNSLAIGQSLPFLKLPNVIFNADPNVAGINSLTLNGAQSDLAIGNGQLVRISAETVA